MLSNSSSRALSVTVNGRKLEAFKGETIMQLCDRYHIKIPRLCHHPNIPPRASCRVCIVECDNSWLAAACVTQVWDGLSINTRSKKVESAVKANLEMLLSVHDERCTSCVSNADCKFRDMCYDYGAESRQREPAAPKAVDRSTNAIQLDMAKCVLCGRCVRECEHVTGLNALQFTNRAYHMQVEPALGKKLNQTPCVQCGQCTLYCPVGAATEKSQARQVFNDIRSRSGKVQVAILDPSASTDLGEELGLNQGQAATGKIVTFLKELGFDLVIDGAAGGDLFLQEEAQELLKRIGDKKAKLPLFSSSCPAFVNYVEQSRPEILKSLSTTRSPQASISAVVKNILPKNWSELSLHPEDFYIVTISSCLAHKEEIERANLYTKNGIKETDVHISTRELAEIVRINGSTLSSLPNTPFDSVCGTGSAAAIRLSQSGAIAEGVLATAYQSATKQLLPSVQFTPVKGLQSVRVAQVEIKGQNVKVGVVDGLRNAVELIDHIQSGDSEVQDLKYVEVLACPTGCINGGGSPHFEDPAVMESRINALTTLSATAEFGRPSESPSLKKLLSKDAKAVHALLHTSFKARPK